MAPFVIIKRPCFRLGLLLLWWLHAISLAYVPLFAVSPDDNSSSSLLYKYRYIDHFGLVLESWVEGGPRSAAHPLDTRTPSNTRHTLPM